MRPNSWSKSIWILALKTIVCGKLKRAREIITKLYDGVSPTKVLGLLQCHPALMSQDFFTVVAVILPPLPTEGKLLLYFATRILTTLFNKILWPRGCITLYNNTTMHLRGMLSLPLHRIIRVAAAYAGNQSNFWQLPESRTGKNLVCRESRLTTSFTCRQAI